MRFYALKRGRRLEPKELYEAADAEHIDLCDRTDRISFDKLAEFFRSSLS